MPRSNGKKAPKTSKSTDGNTASDQTAPTPENAPEKENQSESAPAEKVAEATESKQDFAEKTPSVSHNDDSAKPDAKAAQSAPPRNALQDENGDRNEPAAKTASEAPREKASVPPVSTENCDVSLNGNRADSSSNQPVKLPQNPIGQAGAAPDRHVSDNPLGAKTSIPAKQSQDVDHKQNPQQRPNKAPGRPQGQNSRNGRSPIIKTLSDIRPYVETDCFAQLIRKERLRTKDGKPFYKVSFRDNKTTVVVFIWADSSQFAECERVWREGAFYKIRAALRDSSYNAKLELRRIRLVEPGDAEDGFAPNKCRPVSLAPPEALMSEILQIAKAHITKAPLRRLLHKFFKDNRAILLELSASRNHHHTWAGGLLEHTLSVVKISLMLADHFIAGAPRLRRLLSKELLVAGAILHDAGKVIDSIPSVAGSERTTAGNLIGHAVLGAGVIQKYALEAGLDFDTMIKLEHLVLTHSRFQDWGAPMPPATLEAMILHYADYADSTFSSSLKILQDDAGVGEFTKLNSPFGTPLFRPVPFDPVPETQPQGQNKQAPPDGSRRQGVLPGATDQQRAGQRPGTVPPQPQSRPDVPGRRPDGGGGSSDNSRTAASRVAR